MIIATSISPIHIWYIYYSPDTHNGRAHFRIVMSEYAYISDGGQIRRASTLLSILGSETRLGMRQVSENEYTSCAATDCVTSAICLPIIL